MERSKFGHLKLRLFLTSPLERKRLPLFSLKFSPGLLYYSYFFYVCLPFSQSVGHHSVNKILRWPFQMWQCTFEPSSFHTGKWMKTLMPHIGTTGSYRILLQQIALNFTTISSTGTASCFGQYYNLFKKSSFIIKHFHDTHSVKHPGEKLGM